MADVVRASGVSAGAPCVTVGIPCYNRPDLLLRAVLAVQAQTYRNLTIVISDNASTNPEVERICRELAAADSRTHYVRQPQNLGAMPNFEFVLKAATTDYFMWAADDDRIDPLFIQTCMDFHLGTGTAPVLVAPEACYETPDGVDFPFFPEGDAYRADPGEDAAGRAISVVRHGFGNLIYGVFKREALFHRGQPLTQWIRRTRNELPMFALLATKGQIVSLPQQLWHKRAPAHVGRSAHWERVGGWRAAGPGLLTPRHIFVSQRKYHQDLAQEIAQAIRASDLTPAEQIRVITAARNSLWRHWRTVLIGWKTPAIST
jgi:glycosyltransferase involved in cell wall biosynthesis